MLRLLRRNRTNIDLGILNSGNFMDFYDNAVKLAFRLNDEEYDYLCESLSNEDLKYLILREKQEGYTFAEKRKLLQILSENLKDYYIINGSVV